MFRGYWIVADMDGTLTPTPSRAHGKYLALSLCLQTGLGYGARYRSCIPWLRRFLETGGTLCVVSTAGRRMWTQLYPDLAPSLFRLTEAAAAATPGAPLTCPSPSSAPPRTGPGSLYLCGFTGAALFRSRPWTAVWADMERLHPQWRTSAAGGQDLAAAASSGSTLSATMSSAMVPPAGVGMEEWVEYRQHGSSSSSDASTAGGLTTVDAATCALATREGREALVRFLEHVSYVCGHDVSRARDFFAGCLSTKYHAVFTELLRLLLAEVQPATVESTATGTCDPVPHHCFAQSALLSPATLSEHGAYLRETNDALVEAQSVPRADGTLQGGAAVTQIVVMGIPMRYFNDVFPAPSTTTASAAAAGATNEWHCCPRCAAAGVGARARLEAAGLELKSQPNSVCLHRRGVDKSTCVRWMLAQQREAQDAGRRDTSTPAAAGSGDGFSFDLAHALAFGDVPESVDAPLTVFPPMQFISLSPKDGAAERLGEIERAADELLGTTAPPSSVNSDAPRPPRLHHVGGEEEGTALFLEELLTSSAADAAAGEQNWFAPTRVSACAARARRRMEEEAEQRRSAGRSPPASFAGTPTGARGQPQSTL